jgi:hypothetical protein
MDKLSPKYQNIYPLMNISHIKATMPPLCTRTEQVCSAVLSTNEQEIFGRDPENKDLTTIIIRLNPSSCAACPDNR